MPSGKSVFNFVPPFDFSTFAHLPAEKDNATFALLKGKSMAKEYDKQ